MYLASVWKKKNTLTGLKRSGNVFFPMNQNFISDGGCLVRRQKGESPKARRKRDSFKHGGDNIMVWG